MSEFHEKNPKMEVIIVMISLAGLTLTIISAVDAFFPLSLILILVGVVFFILGSLYLYRQSGYYRYFYLVNFAMGVLGAILVVDSFVVALIFAGLTLWLCFYTEKLHDRYKKGL